MPRILAGIISKITFSIEAISRWLSVNSFAYASASIKFQINTCASSDDGMFIDTTTLHRNYIQVYEQIALHGIKGMSNLCPVRFNGSCRNLFTTLIIMGSHYYSVP